MDTPMSAPGPYAPGLIVDQRPAPSAARRPVALVSAIWLVAGAACARDPGGVVQTDGAPDSTRADAVDRPVDDGGTGTDATVDGGVDTEGGADGAAGEVEPPRCVSSGGLWFSPPQALPTVGGNRGFQMAAGVDRQLTVVAGSAGGPGVFYVDSSDGGRTFRPAFQLSNFGPDNVQIAVGPNHVYLTSALFTLYASTILWHGQLDSLTDPSSFEVIQFGPEGTYQGTPVTAGDGRVALLLENATLDAAPTEGEYISSASSDASFGDPHQLFWPAVCAGGIYHSNGNLFMAYPVQDLNGNSFMEMRWSADNGATFSDPISRDSSGGQVWCPKLYELPTGQLLTVTREGFGSNPPQRTIAAPFDVSAKQFGATVIVEEGHVLCFDAARTASGRQFVTSTFGDLGMPSTGVDLRYSDDGGLTWSDPLVIPGMSSPTDVCPVLAASADELYILWRDASAQLVLSRAGASNVCN
jgi:hypothetical protein